MPGSSRIKLRMLAGLLRLKEGPTGRLHPLVSHTQAAGIDVNKLAGDRNWPGNDGQIAEVGNVKARLGADLTQCHAVAADWSCLDPLITAASVRLLRGLSHEVKRTITAKGQSWPM